MEGPLRAISRRGQGILRTVPAIGLILLLALVLAAVAGTVAPVSAAYTNYMTPASSADIAGRDPLHNRDWGRVSDDWRASADSSAHSGQYYGFGLSVPAGATVDGIVVTVEGYHSAGSTRTFNVSLSYNGGANWTATKNTGPMTTSEATYPLGGSADNWGYASWTPAIVNSNNLRVRLDVTTGGMGTWIYLDSVQVRVYYRDGTTTTVASSANPSTYGDSVTFTATVTRTSGTSTPTGMVEFWDGATLLGTDTLSTVSDGVAEATLAASSLDAGSHSITAVYGGDTNFGGSTGNLGGGQTVNQRPVTVTADAQSKVYGESDPAFTYQITSGSLAFSDTFSGALSRAAGENVGTYAIQQGTLTLGSNYNITYVGANLSITTKSLTISANDCSKVHGVTVTFAGTEFTAVGLVNSDTVTSVTLTSAGADAAAASGIYDITPSAATGTGLGNYSITYVDGTFTVKKAITIWNVTSSPTRSSRGNTVTFTATVNDPGPTGTVTFKDGGIVLGSGTLSNGGATCTTSTLSKGSHYITIVYDGDANFTEGSSLAHLHGVNTPAGFPWWIIVVIIAAAATGGLFFWLFLRRRRQQGQPAYA